MSEWFKEPVLKTGESETAQGFKSLSLRHILWVVAKRLRQRTLTPSFVGSNPACPAKGALSVSSFTDKSALKKLDRTCQTVDGLLPRSVSCSAQQKKKEGSNMPVLFVKNTVTEKTIESILKPINSFWTYTSLTDVMQSNDSRLDKARDFAAITFTDENDCTIIADRLMAENIQVFLTLPVTAESAYANISNDKKANISYWDHLDNIAEDFVQNLLYECYDKDTHAQTPLSEEDRQYVLKAALEAAIEKLEDLKKEFPFMDVPS